MVQGACGPFARLALRNANVIREGANRRFPIVIYTNQWLILSSPHHPQRYYSLSSRSRALPRSVDPVNRHFPMDFFYDNPFASSPMATSQPSSSTSTPSARFSSSSSSATAVTVGGSMIVRSLEHVVSVVLTVIFAIVGSFAGAITGGLIGLATESGLFRGAGIGAISGAVFSIEVVESSLAIWHSHGSGIGSILFVLDTILSLLSGRLVREKIGPAVQNAVQSQMSAIDTPFQEILDIFETGGTKGMMKDAVEGLPTMIITPENDSDSSGERICCSVCLQDFQRGETVRKLPHCHHMFHLPCIDSWLMRHGSCPLCRRDF